MKRHALCALHDLSENSTRGFDLGEDSRPRYIFIVLRKQRVYGYVNRCPHLGATMEWLPDQFLDYQGVFIQCALHGALFAVNSGLCLRGPCIGASLQKVRIEIDNGQIFALLDQSSKL
ncbi:MAG: Rieske 2Fe-2S domain-containing protein [gamma proteobacterium symbiont of Bathyaustriella thionipta]|nr:Rieske 2Fe-2S domain-containing protein [gamma proteobacterium symbiont of Bathyaustriella thionipta]